MCVMTGCFHRVDCASVGKYAGGVFCGGAVNPCGTRPSLHLQRLHGQPVHAVVEVVVGMAFYLDESHVVPVDLRQEGFPQVSVFDVLLPGRFPPALDPVVRPPLIDGIGHIGAIGVERDAAAGFERPQGFDDRHELHAVVRRMALGTRDDALMVAVHQDSGPSARTRVAAARAVGVYGDFFQWGALVFERRHRNYMD